jgi:hypothetical protein
VSLNEVNQLTVPVGSRWVVQLGTHGFFRGAVDALGAQRVVGNVDIGNASFSL